MLPQQTQDQLTSLCTKLSVPVKRVSHRATLSAAETQAVLPTNCLVQKTITDKVADQLVMWTGVGDFRISHSLYKMVNKIIEVPMSAEHTLNPSTVDAVQFYGMQPGMVSPFLIPGTPAMQRVAAIFVLDWSKYDPALSVAISLSLHTSLIVPLLDLEKLLRAYAASVYAPIPLYIVGP